MFGVFTFCFRFSAAPLLCGVLCICGVSSLPESQPDDEKKPATTEVEGLAALAAPRNDQDHERLHQALHGAHLLAEAGAGYEAARVLAALAFHAPDTDPGREAGKLLKSWGLTIAAVRRATPESINATISQTRLSRQHDGAQGAHVRNLIELKLYAQAALVIHEDVQSIEPQDVERNWGEILERYRVPIELLLNATDGEQLEAALRRGHERTVLRRHVQLLRIFDQEAAELGRMLFDRLEPRRVEVDREPREAEQFRRWVERAGEREREREHEPATAELLHHVMRIVSDLAAPKPEAARILASLIIEVAPDSIEAARAREMTSEAVEQVPNTLQRQFRAEDDAGAELFASAPPRVRAYQLELSDAAIELLHEEPKEYVRATFREGDQVYENVGVRLKGGWGSFRMIDGESKAAFTVKFNEFDKEQRFHGLRRIILNNGVQDPTFMHESIGYSLFRDAGIPAPRIAYATLAVNGEPYGLYVQIEAVTSDFLKPWFAETDGNLYEGPGDVLNWRELDLDSNHERDNRSDLRLLVRSIEQADDDDPWKTLSETVDADLFARFLAVEQLVGHWDGYTQTNNYRMYHDPTTDKFVFIPHGADQLFEEATGPVFGNQGGILGRALLQTEPGRQRYLHALRQVLQQVWNEDSIRSQIAGVYQLIRPHVASGEGKGRHHLHEFEERVSHMLRFIDLRRYAVLSQLRASGSGNSWRERHHHGGIPSFLFHDGADW